MTGIYADLHMHTTLSDGKTKPDEIVKYAKNNGLKSVALTDHDRVHQDREPLEHIDGVDVISGIELRVESEYLNERIDLLGYGVLPNDRLKSVLQKIQKNRKTRANSIIDNIEEKTGVRINLTPSENTGRPHIAHAIDSSEELNYNYEEAFDGLIGRDCECYVSRNVPSFRYGLELLQDCCSFISLAHPFRYDNVEKSLKLSRKLDGVECIYPYNQEIESHNPPMDELAVNWFDLTMTGGSDAHNSGDIGVAGLMKTHYLDFLEESGLKFHSGHF